MAEQLDTPGLPCPECRQKLIKGKRDIVGMNRIGNRRGRCDTCNNFSQAVMRRTRARLKELHEDEYEVIRLQVEKDLYALVMERWTLTHTPDEAAAYDFVEAETQAALDALAKEEASDS